jgi:hypothetical protein
LLNIFLKDKAVVLHNLHLHELVSAQFAQQVSEHALAFDSETQFEDFDRVAHFLSLIWSLMRFRAFKTFFEVLLEVYLKSVELRVKVYDVVVFDAELCDLLGFVDLAVRRPNHALNRIDPLDGALKVQSAVLACRQDNFEGIDLEVLGILHRVLVSCPTYTFRGLLILFLLDLDLRWHFSCRSIDLLLCDLPILNGWPLMNSVPAIPFLYRGSALCRYPTTGLHATLRI